MSLWGSLTGSTQRRDLQRGYQESQGFLDRGRQQADTALTQGRDTATNYLQPYMQGGQRGQTAYENTLGLNGREAQGQQFGDWQADPARAYRDQNNLLQMNALMRRYNAGGAGVNSGAAVLGAGRLATEQFNNDWTNYQNRLQGLGQQGGQYAAQAGNWAYGTGQGLANNATNYANTSAGNRINIANGMAQASTSGVNNLLGLAGTVGRFAFGSGPGGGSGGGGGGASSLMSLFGG